MAEKHTGVIKSYGLTRGYGFIISDQLPGEEIFFSNKALPKDVIESFAERSGMQLANKPVTFCLLNSERGKLQASEVMLSAGDGDEVVGKVKSYNSMKGFGFLASACVDGDVFFSKKDLPAICQEMQLQNAHVRFKLFVAPDGKMQAKELYPHALLAMASMPWVGNGAQGAPFVSLREAAMAHRVVQSQQHLGNPGNAVDQGDYMSYQSSTPDGAPMAIGAPPPLFWEGQGCQGTIKSYNPSKGFGFLQVPDRPGDVYFKKECLPDHMKDEDLSGRAAAFTVHLAPDGKPQVKEMDVMDSGEATAGTKRNLEADGGPAAKRIKMDMTGGRELLGFVKSYNVQNGWGFIRSPSCTQDIYFKGNHPESIAGLPCRFNLAYTPDGKPQANTLRF